MQEISLSQAGKDPLEFFPRKTHLKGLWIRLSATESISDRHPLPSYHQTHCCRCFSGQPQNRSRDLSTSGPGWRFYLGRNSIGFGPMSGKGNGKISIAWGLMFLPSKRQKSIYGMDSHKIVISCVFFFLWRGCRYGSNKISIHKKNTSNFNQNRLGSR